MVTIIISLSYSIFSHGGIEIEVICILLGKMIFVVSVVRFLYFEKLNTFITYKYNSIGIKVIYLHYVILAIIH